MRFLGVLGGESAPYETRGGADANREEAQGSNREEAQGSNARPFAPLARRTAVLVGGCSREDRARELSTSGRHNVHTRDGACKLSSIGCNNLLCTEYGARRCLQAMRDTK